MNYNINEIKDVIIAYNTKNYDYLSNKLSSHTRRIKLETWLFQQLSQEQAQFPDFAWRSRVVALLCSKAREDASLSLKNRKKEDHNIAKIIDIAESETSLEEEPPFEENRGWLDNISHIAKRLLSLSSSEQALDLPEIQYGIQNAYFPETCAALLKKLLKRKDFNFDSILNTAVVLQNLSMIKALAKEFPDQFKEMLTLTHAYDLSPLLIAVSNNYIDIVKFMAAAAPEAFKMGVEIKNNQGLTPFHMAVKNKQFKLFKLLAEKAPTELKAVMTLQDENGNTLLRWAAVNNHLEMVKLMAEKAPEEFKAALVIQDTLQDSGFTPLHWAVFNNNFEILKLMVRAAPQEFNAALAIQSKKEVTPLDLAIYTNNLKMVEFIDELAPETFKDLLDTPDKDAWTPLHKALKLEVNYEMIALLAKKGDNSSIYRITDKGDSILSLVKQKRPANIRHYMQIVKGNDALISHYQTLIARKALSHAFDISGHSLLTDSATDETIGSIKLEGHLPEEWWHLMRKNLPQFQEHYPHVLSHMQMTWLDHLLDLGANANSYSQESKLEIVKAGTPVILNTGYSTHAITVLIWGNQIAICNRGGASRRPIEIYHFNPLNLNQELLNQIEKTKKGTSKDYEDLFFRVLPEKLQFSQDKLDRQMESAFYFPDQTVGNCSFVSPVTAIFAFLLMGNLRGMDDQGHLLEEGSMRAEKIKENKINTMASYQIWLADLQLGFLENNIHLINASNPDYVPDHPLIVNALREAHTLPLDAYAEKRLEDLTTLYINTLDEKDAAKIKSDLIYWKNSNNLRYLSLSRQENIFAPKKNW